MSNFDDLKFRTERKVNELKDKFASKVRKGKDWVIMNKGVVLYLTPFVVGGLSTIIKVVGKRANLQKEESIKTLYCYDRSLGHYWRLKRDLSKKEWLIIDRRKRNGERLADILSELRVLK
jgi:hypothetical protein